MIFQNVVIGHWNRNSLFIKWVDRANSVDHDQTALQEQSDPDQQCLQASVNPSVQFLRTRKDFFPKIACKNCMFPDFCIVCLRKGVGQEIIWNTKLTNFSELQISRILEEEKVVCFLSDFFYDVMYIKGYNGKVAHVNYQAQFCDKRRICFALGNKGKSFKPQKLWSTGASIFLKAI